MQSGLIEQQNRILVALFELYKEDEVEREKPLESRTTTFKLYVDTRSLIVRHPYTKKLSVCTVTNIMPPLLPPFRKKLCDIIRRRIQLDSA